MSKEINNNKKEAEIEVIDLEEYAKQDKKPGKAKTYKVKIDHEKRDFHKSVVTGEEILSSVNKSFDEYKLFQRIKGQGKRIIEKDQEIDLTEKGVERFTTQKQNVKDGRA
ncbi:MAG: multiubiquitin domain-containing protein [Balneola sp.]